MSLETLPSARFMSIQLPAVKLRVRKMEESLGKKKFMVATCRVCVEIIFCQETKCKHSQSFSPGLAHVDVPAKARNNVQRPLIFYYFFKSTIRNGWKKKCFIS